jgi:dTDP-glucose 4,6-dehydratase
MRILVTGGAGFIGANFVQLVLATHADAEIVTLDLLTYAGNLANLEPVLRHPRHRFVRGDIADAAAVDQAIGAGVDAVVNFAAESHVDRSIDDASAFLATNVVGTQVLLDAARRRGVKRFLQVSTDEVYGSLGPSGKFSETTPYAPNSPYAATKAAADHLVRAYHETYGLPALMTNCSNNYGPYQYPEKLIPLMILNALEGQPLPIYGDGGNVRDWLYVEDHCEGILSVLQRGRVGGKYNIGGDNERTNLELVERLCAVLEEIEPSAQNHALTRRGLAGYAALKAFVADRPGHDRRYAIDASLVRSELGWRPRHDFESGLRATVAWYQANRAWCEAVQAGRDARQRLGVRGRVA